MQNVCFGAMGMAMAFSPASDRRTASRAADPPMRRQWKLG